MSPTKRLRPPRSKPIPQATPDATSSGARRWDCSGGEDFTSRGLERQLGESIVGLLRLAKGCPTKYKLKPPFTAEGYLRGTRGTPNHRLGAKVAYYGWAMAVGGAAVDARDLLAEDFDRQAAEGHMLGELMTTSHYQIWCYQIAAARAFALHYSDQLIVEKTGRWLRHDAYLLDLVTVDGIPVSPGARPAGRSNPLRTAIASVIYGNRPCPVLPKGWGNPNVETHAFWRNTYNVGAHILRELKRDGDDLGGVTRGEREEPVLRDPMFVERRGEDYVFSIPKFTKSGPSVMPWVARIGGVESDSGEFRKGQNRDWISPSPAPKLSGAALAMVRGVMARPFDMDSDEEEDA